MDKQYWFPATRPGCGWGWPLGWQGWVPPAAARRLAGEAPRHAFRGETLR